MRINREIDYLIKFVICPLTVVLLIFFAILLFRDYKNQLESDYEKMIEKAEWFWSKGDDSRAIWQLDVYLERDHSTAELTSAYSLLEEIYNEIGKEEQAQKCRKMLAKVNGKKTGGDNEVVISAGNIVDFIKPGTTATDITIEADYYDTEGMILTISSSNLMPDNSFDGLIVAYDTQLDKGMISKTTDWFPVCSSQKKLTLSGGVNSSIWQFMDEHGEIIKKEKVEKTFNDLDSYYTGNTIWSTVSIPEDAISARVTYWTGEKTSVFDNPVIINYGSYPRNSSNDNIEIEIPDLKLGEKLIYKADSAEWKLITQEGEVIENLPQIDIDGGCTVSLEGDSVGSVEIHVTQEKRNWEGYGVRWNNMNTYPIGERIGNATQLDFGYEIGNQWVGTGKANSFDQIYPWSDIKLCIIEDDGTISYIDNDTCNEVGNVDVMVKIPKFYVRRTVDQDYESIWISPTKDEGFIIDPAFVKNGKELDCVYVSAYLSGFDDHGSIGSYYDSQPIINLSLNTVNDMISEKGEGWSEIDITTLSMIQKLFLVETACKDSQALCMGVVNLSWGTCYAENNTEVTNAIELEYTPQSDKFQIGDSVTVFDVPDGSSYYSVLCQYQNNTGWDRIITGRKDMNNGLIRIEFSGSPVKISKGVTMIMHLPHRTGKTNAMLYHTGQISISQSGNIPFRYRYIENLWGSCCVLLEGMSVCDGQINIRDNVNDITLGYELVVQDGTPSEGVSPAVASILSMGFDDNYPLYMLPSDCGNGASSTTAWCDAIFYQKCSKPMIMTYGLTWDLRQYAGLFAYRACKQKDEPQIEAGSRLIYR